MKKMIVSAAAFAVVALTAVAVAPTSAMANSAFARQTGQACSACHFQSIPRLNDFGRKFRVNAFRDTGTAGLIEDEGLSLPAQFNAGLNMALALSNGDYKLNGVTESGGGIFFLPDLPGPGGIHSNTGVAWPVMAEMVVGGRYGDHFGGVTTVGLVKTGAGYAPGLEHYKLAFVYDTEMGPLAVAGGSTESRGVAYLLNDPSNTFGNNLAGWGWQSVALGLDSNWNGTNSGVNSGGMTALGIYTHLNGMAYLALGGVIPHAINDGMAVNFKVSPYVRAAFTGNIVGFDVVAGGWYYANKLGDWNAAALGVANQTTTQYGVDLQVQGNVGGGVSVGFYLPWQIKGEDFETATATTDDDVTGLYPMLTVASGPFGARLGYDYATIEHNGTAAPKEKSKAWVVGAWYNVAQNVVVELEYDNAKWDDGAGGNSDKHSAITGAVVYVY